MWSTKDGKPIGSPIKMVNRPVTGLALSPDGKHLYSGDSQGAVHVWDAITGALIHTLAQENGLWLHSLILSPDGKTLFASYNNGHVLSWDTKTQKAGPPITHRDSGGIQIALSPDGKELFTGGSDGSVYRYTQPNQHK